MIDAQWVPDKDTDVHQDENTNENFYSEVSSGCWYKRTYDKMIMIHVKKSLLTQLCLLR